MSDAPIHQKLDLTQLRSELMPLVLNLKDAVTHELLPDLCRQLGMPEPPAIGSKRDRIRDSFSAVSDTDLPTVARKLLQKYPPDAQSRNTMQDLLWAVESFSVQHLLATMHVAADYFFQTRSWNAKEIRRHRRTFGMNR